MSETRKLAAILVSDVVGYSRLTGADEDRILARLRTLRGDLIDPTIAVHHGRIVKRTGDGSLIELSHRNGKYISGRNDETEAHIREALRLSPRDRGAGSWFALVGFAKLGAGCDDEATSWFRRSIEANPELWMSHFLLAAASARLNRMEEEHDALRAGFELNPSFTIARFRSKTFSDHPVYLAGRERMYERLRKSGWPDGQAKTH
jgi:class 3 adenylate cyclase